MEISILPYAHQPAISQRRASFRAESGQSPADLKGLTNEKSVSPAADVGTARGGISVRESHKTKAVYYASFCSGLVFVCLGPLLPTIQAHYEIDYLTASSMFIAQCGGSITAAILGPILHRYLGTGKVMAIGSCFQLLSTILFTIPGPFALLPLAATCFGVAFGFQDAQSVSYITGRSYASAKLGRYSGCWAVGAVLSPLISTALVNAGISFHIFFLIPLGLTILSLLNLLLAFRLQPELEYLPTNDNSLGEGCLRLEDLPSPPTSGYTTPVSTPGGTAFPSPSKEPGAFLETHVPPTSSSPANASECTPPRSKPAHGQASVASLFRRVLTDPIVWTVAAYIMVYVGSELCVGNWAVTYLLELRAGGPRTGYVLSGFWAGLALARLIHAPISSWLGETRAQFIYIGLTVVFDLVLWLVRSYVADVVAIVAMGFALGPMIPIAYTVAARIINRENHIVAMGFFSAVGQGAAALLPFVMGSAAQRFGVMVLPPTVMAVCILMFLTWTAVAYAEWKRIKKPLSIR